MNRNKKDLISYRSLLLTGLLNSGILVYCSVIIPRSHSSSEGHSAIEQSGEVLRMMYAEGAEEAVTVSTSDGLPEPKEFSKPQQIYYTTYRISKGDTIIEIADAFGLTTDTVPIIK